MQIKRRIGKLETLIPRVSEEDILKQKIKNMSHEERMHRTAELIYKNLCETDPYVKTMRQTEFIAHYVGLDPDERYIQYNKPIYEQLTKVNY